MAHEDVVERYRAHLLAGRTELVRNPLSISNAWGVYFWPPLGITGQSEHHPSVVDVREPSQRHSTENMRLGGTPDDNG